MRNLAEYKFNWIDENGMTTGFNSVWARTIGEARKEARKIETEAHWALWNPVSRKYDTVPAEVYNRQHCFRMKGMYINPKSFKRMTREEGLELNRLGNMMSM